MTTLAEGRVDLDREALHYGVVPEPGDLSAPIGSLSARRTRLFGPLGDGGGPLDLQALAERLGPVLEG